MLDEGYIKFRCQHIEAPLPVGVPVELKMLRDRLRREGLVGVLPDGIGFGNVSMRGVDGFWITASQTGQWLELPDEGYSWVYDCDAIGNTVRCLGVRPASSETMTHAACYQANPDIMVVIHIHHDRHWSATRGVLVSTGAEIPYGTPEMAMAVTEEVILQGYAGSLRMEGHMGGLLYWGRSVDEAYTQIGIL